MGMRTRSQGHCIDFMEIQKERRVEKIIEKSTLERASLSQRMRSASFLLCPIIVLLDKSDISVKLISLYYNISALYVNSKILLKFFRIVMMTSALECINLFFLFFIACRAVNFCLMLTHTHIVAIGWVRAAFD